MPTEQHFRPACYQDLLDGATIFERTKHDGFVEIVPGCGKHCSTITGETFHMGWKWKGVEIGGSQGHLHKTPFTDASAFRLNTQSEPRL